MASVSGLGNSNSLNSTSSLRGYGGLASGLDRDTLIEQLTYATRSKIAKQKQNKQSLTWEQEAIRGITDKTYAFTEKYTSYSSSSNLTSSTLFSRNKITAMGANSKFVGISGASNTADSISILGVKQTAQDAQIMGGVASNATLNTSDIKNDFINNTIDASLLQGQSFIVRHGTNSYMVTLGSGDDYKYGTDSEIADSINKSLSNVELEGGQKLSDVLSATVTDGKLQLKNTDTHGNSVEITGGIGKILKNLGFLDADEALADDALLLANKDDVITGKNAINAWEHTSYTKYLEGKTMTFEYNGARKNIEIGKDLASTNDLQADLQTKLDSAFGKGRIKVGLEPNADGTSSKLIFKTTKPDGTAPDGTIKTVDDKSSMLTIADADDGLLGKTGFFGVEAGHSNRINLGDSLLQSGVANSSGVDTSVAAKLIINGKEVAGVTWDSSVDDILKAVNEDETLGVSISYMSNSDRFIIKSTEKGASGKIKLEGNVADYLFGDAVTNTEVLGKDAIMTVKYAGDSGTTEITRDSNAFTVDGLNISLKGTFGYNASGDYDSTTEAITFDAKVDTENTSKIVKEMIDSFNEMTALINKEVKQKKDRNYEPLTDEQREQMSEEQIKSWETKAKAGILFNDTDVRAFADALRFVVPNVDSAELAKMGITVSESYGDNGKLVFNETKFKAALESDPEKVKEIFTRKAVVDADGNTVVEGGLMDKMSTSIKKYAGTLGATKGALIERAGSIYAPTTAITNNIQKQMDEIDKTIKALNTKLKTEQDRYIRQFTSMETMISQMNSQSSYLSQMSGGL